MKRKIRQIATLSIVCIMCTGSILHAQSAYKIVTSKDNNMKLSGTSTLHKWDMNARDFGGTAQFSLKSDNTQLGAISALSFTLQVTNLKSDSKGLDDNAYKALKTDEYKDIKYKLTSATVVPQTGNVSLVKTKGELTIAGVTKQVAMDVNCIVNKDGSITCKGEDKLNMTDYEVKPPTFMAGAMKTGDAITLDFTMVYNK